MMSLNLRQQRRRQNRSCDSCRKAKRACNSPLLGTSHSEVEQPGAAIIPYRHSSGVRGFMLVGPCSNCHRRRKECTFRWAASRIKHDNGKISCEENNETVTLSRPMPNGIQAVEPYESQTGGDEGDTEPVELPNLQQAHETNEEYANSKSATTLTSSNPKLSWQNGFASRSSGSPHIYKDSWFVSGEIAKRYTGRILSYHLLQVYHDSVENALSCVLTERNCPYTGYFYRATSGSTVAPSLAAGTDWGPTWTNRIVNQVCQADHVCDRLRGRTLTAAEEHAVSKALHLTIMSFAMQWKAGQSSLGSDSDRTLQRVEYIESTTSTSGASFLSVTQDFREEAFRALQECSHIESLRVAFSFLLASLANRQLDDMDVHLAVSAPGVNSAGCMRTVESLLSSDRSPFLVEIGARRLFSLRYKLEQFQRKTVAEKSSALPNRSDLSSKSSFSYWDTSLISTDDAETFQLVSWLAVIIDTVTAAMYGRPLVISDEDSTISLTVQTMTGSGENSKRMGSVEYHPINQRTASVWGDLFFYSGSQVHSSPSQMWPYSYERMAAIISDFVPVKLLLFRRLTRVQTLLYRGAKAIQLEDAILDTARLLEFWDHTYGPFMNEFMAHHNELAPRLQSWYVMITGHWHLGVIIYANLIQEIDSGHLGLESKRAERESLHYAYYLKKKSSTAASDLAQLSLNKNRFSSTSSKEFYKLFQGIGSSLLLIDPWSNLFIRLFIQAAVFFYKEISEIRDDPYSFVTTGTDTHDDVARRCHICIDALRCLGRISDVAQMAARILLEGLENAILGRCLIDLERSNFGGFPWNSQWHSYFMKIVQ